MHASADMFTHRESWRSPLAWSIALHAALFGSLVLWGAVLNRSGAGWGDSTASGGAISATLVNNIPLPATPVDTENILANQSKGLSQSLPPEKPAQPEPEAVPIPDSHAKVAPAPVERPVEQPKAAHPTPTQTAKAQPK